MQRTEGRSGSLIGQVLAISTEARSLLDPTRTGRGLHYRAQVSVPDEALASQPPRGHVQVIYLGPVAPHWDVIAQFGDRAVVEEFRQRALARLLLIPPHDPQFRRNKERVARDAEREALILDWDLGVPEEEIEAGP